MGNNITFCYSLKLQNMKRKYFDNTVTYCFNIIHIQIIKPVCKFIIIALKCNNILKVNKIKEISYKIIINTTIPAFNSSLSVIY